MSLFFMQPKWASLLEYDPLAHLQSVSNPAIQFFVQRDLLDNRDLSVEKLWTLPGAEKVLRRQQPNGSWPDKNKKKHANSPTNYAVLETYRSLRVLVECYGLNKKHPAIQKAAEFLFSTQTSYGDFRGIYGTQFTTNYSGGILEFLVKAGYDSDARIDRAFKWFMSVQQDDGGWLLPVQVAGLSSLASDDWMQQPTEVAFDPTLPSSHMVAGIVIRAFANHPKYRQTPEARKAADFLVSRIFKSDKYTFRQHKSYWTKYTFPFWWNDLIGCLDALSLMHYPVDTPGVQGALHHFRTTQLPNGSWRLDLLAAKTIPDITSWFDLMISRIFKRFYGN
ncbi:MAG: hypothetical protein C4K48_08885 [Candidatus Thorarchaeota archaeon]|nr:MAG: hypothetical protein C4K48_08885 [Candidatus Thorarchaeota archaeon]